MPRPKSPIELQPMSAFAGAPDDDLEWEWDEVKAAELTFKEKWDEWIPLDDRPSSKQDSSAQIHKSIEDAIKGVFADPKQFLARLKARYKLNGLESSIALADFECQVQSAYPRQFYHAGKLNPYEPGGEQYVSVVVKATLPGERKIAFGFIVDFIFGLSDKAWQLSPIAVSEPVYEIALVSSIEGDIPAKLIKLQENPDLSEEDRAAATKSFQDNMVDKTPRALALLKGPKLDAIAYEELEELLKNLSDNQQGRLQQRIATFLNERARTGGVSMSKSSLSDVVAFFGKLDESTMAAIFALNGLPIP